MTKPAAPSPSRAARKGAAALSSSLVVRKGAAAPSPGVPARAADAPAMTTGRSEPLNFRVTADFRRRFKVYAAEHDLSLSELLEKAFDALERSDP